MSLISEHTAPVISQTQTLLLQGPYDLLTLSKCSAIYSGDFEAAVSQITRTAGMTLGVERFSIWLYRKDLAELSQIDTYLLSQNCHTSGLSMLAVDYPHYFEGLATREWLVINDVAQVLLDGAVGDGVMDDFIQGWLQPRNIQAVLEVPIRQAGQVVGLVRCEQVGHPQPWQLDAQSFVIAIATLTALALENQQRQQQSLVIQQQQRQLNREIIERKQAELAWQESQLFIQNILDASTNILYVNDFASGHNFYISRWISKVLGYQPEDIAKMGDHFLEKLTHVDDLKTMRAQRRKLTSLNNGEIIEMEFRLKHRQRNWRWLLCRETIFQRDAEGIPIQIFGTVTDITERKQAEEALYEVNRELKRLASVDGLTQVANRRSFDEYLLQEWGNIRKHPSPLTLILCDIDYFKRYNDAYGHQAGDLCLQQVAQAIDRAVKRGSDLVARYGGEEFAIVLPNTSLEGAKQVVGDIQREVKALLIPHSGSSVSPYVTVSLGIAATSADSKESPDALIAAADRGLYRAKYEGRNRCCLEPI